MALTSFINWDAHSGGCMEGIGGMEARNVGEPEDVGKPPWLPNENPPNDCCGKDMFYQSYYSHYNCYYFVVLDCS